MWTFDEKSNTYVTEASAERSGLCPKCYRVINDDKCEPEATDGEITEWNYICFCGAKLTIFND